MNDPSFGLDAVRYVAGEDAVRGSGRRGQLELWPDVLAHDNGPALAVGSVGAVSPIAAGLTSGSPAPSDGPEVPLPQIAFACSDRYSQVSITVSGFSEMLPMPSLSNHSAKSGWSEGP
jgi:hypothetical protein